MHSCVGQFGQRKWNINAMEREEETDTWQHMHTHTRMHQWCHERYEWENEIEIFLLKKHS